MCNFNDVYYDLAELRKEACPEWFERDEEEKAAWLEEKKAHSSDIEDGFKIEYKLCLEAMDI